MPPMPDGALGSLPAMADISDLSITRQRAEPLVCSRLPKKEAKTPVPLGPGPAPRKYANP